jgi:malate dehydrogenase (quinone)
MAERIATVDVVLAGAGIMSATLGMLLKELQPDITISVFERLDIAAAESSDAWNNAGTGHSAFCELNYTPQQPDGTVDTTKAVKIAASFEESKQFWAYMIENKLIDVPESFIRKVPHMSFVHDDDVDFLRKRYEALTSCHLFKGMQYSESYDKLQEWMPLMMEGRDHNQRVAATRMDLGTDVNFGSLTRCMFDHLKTTEGVKLFFNHEVRNLKQDRKKRWRLQVKDMDTGETRMVAARFVFLGAGGGSLPLLLKSRIPEGKGFGGFPVSGQWLRCVNDEIIAEHNAKVYGQAPVGSPPMSVPHLDTRFIKNKRELLFGPYAGFTTKFLKQGSRLDMVKSLRPKNLFPMMAAGLHNIPLTKYLIQQVMQSPEDRLDALKEFVPNAKLEDWKLEVAGQRVQVIKKDEKEGGVLEFGTEVVSAEDGSLAALLGASPGASTAVSIMITVLNRCFKGKMQTPEWQQKLKQMIPSYGGSLATDAKLCAEVRAYTSRVLKL